MTFLPFIAGLLIMFASLVGVIFISKYAQETVMKNMPYLVSFSAGVFLFTAGFMIVESYHIFGMIPYVLLGVLGGYILATLVARLLPKMHHHHDECCDTHESNGKNVLFGDAIHNIADGLILVPAFAISPLLGFGTAFSLFFHELLQEISEFLVLKQAGYSDKKALLYNFGVSATILIGIALGMLIANTVFIQGVLLSLSAGFFLYIISHDLLPHQHLESHNKKSILMHLGLIIIGVLLVGGVQALAGGEHSHDHGTHAASDHEDHEDHYNPVELEHYEKNPTTSEHDHNEHTKH